MDTENGIYYDGTYYDGPNQLHDHATTSNRTVVDSDGLIKWAPHNLFTRSNTLTDAAWAKSNVSVTLSSEVTPDGHQAYDVTINSGATVNAGAFQGESTNSVKRVGFMAKAGAKTWIRLYGRNLADGVWFNLSSGVKGSTVGSPVDSGISPLGDGWYFVFLDFNHTTGATSNLSGFYFTNGDNTNATSGDGVTISGLVAKARLHFSDLGGMQSTGNAADPTYVPTSGSAVYWMGTDHDPVTGEVLGVQGEPAATNLVSDNSTLVSAGNNNGTSVANETGPDGVANSAYTIVDDASGAGGNFYLQRSFAGLSTSTTYTYSVFLKAKSGSSSSVVFLATQGFTTPADGSAYFDLSSGTVGTVIAGRTARIRNFGNGWYRCSITFTTDASDNSGNLRIGVAESDGDQFADWDGSFQAIVWREQFEPSSVATSCIPTNGATATRAAPSVTKPTGEFMPLGGNIVSNGGFDTDASGWTIGGSGAYNSGAVDLDVPGATVALSQSVGVNPIGKLWRIEYTITNHVSGSLRPQFGSTNGAFNTGNGTFVDYIPANSTNSTLLFVNGGAAYQATIDDISIQEVQQDEIVVVTEFECADVAADAVVAALDDASTDLIHFRAHTSQANLFVQDGGVTQADIDAGAISANTTYRAAFKIAADDFAASLAGATAVTDTSGTMPTPTTLRLFNSNGAAALAGIRLRKLITYAGAAGSLDAITDAVVEEAAQPSEVPSLQLIFDDSGSSFTDTGLTI